MGTQVLVQTVDGKQERGTVVSRDGDVGYKVKLDSGPEITFQASDIELHQSSPTSDLLKPAPELIQEVLSHGEGHSFQRANDP